jgi:hypothetical protein
MRRGRMNDEVETAVGLYTSMRRPWEGADEAVSAGAEQPPETSGRMRLRLFLSWATATLATWLAGVKSVLPEGWF